jgi:pectin methylesterase-like acyl-CoA thioesterase
MHHIPIMQDHLPFRAARILPILAALTGLVQNVSALSVKSFYPANGAASQCLDTPLRMVLSGNAVMNWNGSVRIRNVATNAVVQTWTVTSNPGDPQTTSVGANWPWKDSVGYTYRNVWPVVLDSIPEYLAEIRVGQHLLQPDTKYQVEVDGGVLKGFDGSAFSGVAAGAWVFTTKAKPSTKSQVVVAQDNSGDVCSVQAGLDLVPSSSKTAVQVLVKPGYYREMLAARNKDNLRLYGAGVGNTFVRYMNCNNLNTNGSSERNLALLGGNGMQIRALSIINTVSVTGGQAEAFYLQGDTNVVADVFLHSFQDTWLNTGGRVYVQDATLEGSVDFIWGYNPVFFKRCTLVVNRTGGVVVQPRNTNTHGYVFDSCRLSAFSSGYSGCHFARDGGSSYAAGEVMYLHTTIVNGGFLATSPWTINATTDSSTLRFCEYQSKDQNGNLIPITDAQRKRLQCASDSATQHANPSFVLSGWTPSVPTLASVLALFGGSTMIQGSSSPVPLASARLVRDGGGVQLEIVNPGPATVREILPNGSNRVLFQCMAPCNERVERNGDVPGWLEIVQPGKRSVISNTAVEVAR